MNATIDNSIRAISDSATDRRSFYDGFLKVVGQQTGAVSGVAWDCAVHPFRPVAQIQSPDSPTLNVGMSQSDHFGLLRQTALARKSTVLFPQKNETGELPQLSPVILISAVARQNQLELIELFLPGGRSEAEYRQQLHSLEEFCQSAARFADEHSAEQPPIPSPFESATANSQSSVENINPESSALDLRGKLDAFLHRIHRSLDLKETSVEIANELRRVLDCDRVTVIQSKGNHSKVLAISGQPSVNHRSNTVQGIRRVAQKVLPLRKTFWYPDEQRLPEQIAVPLHDYLTESTTRSLVVVPIFNSAASEQTDPNHRPVEPALIGGLVIEHCQQEWNRDAMSPSIELTTEHANDAFRNSYQHRQLLFYPVWKWLGKSKLVLAARNLRVATAVLVGLTIAALLLTFWPADFRLNCPGQLVPVNRSNVFAEIDGTVEAVLVGHGDTVGVGDALIKIDNLDVKYQHQELLGQIDELEQTILAAGSERLTDRTSEERKTRQQNLRAHKALLHSLKEQLLLIEAKLEKLTVSSPAKGKIVTWNVAELLSDRPVTRGEILLEVADVDGEWELELGLADHKVGHLLSALAANESLQVDFILAADPNQRFSGAIREIGTATEVNPDVGQTVRVKVSIDASEFDIRQVKSGVSAYVHCGKRSLGYVWFHPVWEFVQSKLLFPFF